MKNLKKLKTKAELAYQQGRYPIALNHLNELLQEFPEDITYLTRRGECHLRLENYTSGLQDFAKLVQIDNKNLIALGNFGVALIRTGKINEAKDILEYALDIDPNRYDTYINLGTVYQALEKPEKAVQVALKAVEINFKGFMAYNNLGSALSDLGLIKEAREAFITATTLNPNYVTTLINLAQLEVKSGNNTKGINFNERQELVDVNFSNINPDKKNINFTEKHDYKNDEIVKECNRRQINMNSFIVM
jgi:tetratricopeptide (TPR) repeat protein